MASRAGAERVTACEMFRPLCSLASQIAAQNGIANIDFIALRSCDVAQVDDANNAAAADSDDDQAGITMKGKADILVSEILDTVLLGEGVLPSVRDARARLLAPDASVVPESASIIVQLVNSTWADRVSSFAAVDGVDALPTVHLCRSEEAQHCKGTASVPVHVDRLEYQAMSAAQATMHIDLAQPPCDPRQYEEEEKYEFQHETYSNSHTRNRSRVRITTTSSGTVNAILFWWRVRLWNDIELCTGPRSACTSSSSEFAGTDGWWQDHWLQALVAIQPRTVQQGQELLLTTAHTDLRVWFDLQDVPTPGQRLPCIDTPQCECGLHLLYNPLRIAMLSDTHRMRSMYRAIASLVQQVKSSRAASATPTEKRVVCLDTSDGSVCALFAAAAGAETVVSLEQHQLSHMIWSDIVEHNNLHERIALLNLPAHALPDHSLDLLRAIRALENAEQMSMSGDDDDDDLGQMPLIDILLNESFDTQMQYVPITGAFSFWLQRTMLDGMSIATHTHTHTHTHTYMFVSCFNQ
jgi:type III protein arginine methyltransferase